MSLSTVHYAFLTGPEGDYGVAASARGVCAVALPNRADGFASQLRRSFPEARLAADETSLGEALAQLAAYFEGRLDAFDLPLDLNVSPFRRAVLEAVAAIPFGQLRTYGQIAHALGDGAHARAVGAAVGANPIPILIPCHRVVGADGRLTGFGGGLPLKRRLLRLEGHRLEGDRVLDASAPLGLFD